MKKSILLIATLLPLLGPLSFWPGLFRRLGLPRSLDAIVREWRTGSIRSFAASSFSPSLEEY